MIEARAVEFLNDMMPEKLVASAPPAVEVIIIAILMSDDELTKLTAPRPPRGVRVFSQNVLLTKNREQNVAALSARSHPNAIGVIKMYANRHEKMTAEVEPAARFMENKGVHWFLNSVIQGAIEMAHLTATRLMVPGYGDVVECTFLYEVPILSPVHAAFCRAEAERRYEGKLVKDSSGALIVKQENGVRHTDDVLMALSVYCEPRVS